MLLSEKAKYSIEKFEYISNMLYKGDGTGLMEIKNEIEDAISIINFFMSAIPYLNNWGLEIPKDVIELQIKNLENGLKYRDYFLIADTLKYEINDTLTVIVELITEGVIKDEQLF